MDPLQRTAGPAPTASSQDPPRIRRSERNSPVKNRMRETCTSGSVRGGDGDIPTYSALLACIEQRNDIEARQQNAVVSSHGIVEFLVSLGCDHGRDHRVDRGCARAGEVVRRLLIGALGTPK